MYRSPSLSYAAYLTAEVMILFVSSKSNTQDWAEQPCGGPPKTSLGAAAVSSKKSKLLCGFVDTWTTSSSDSCDLCSERLAARRWYSRIHCTWRALRLWTNSDIIYSNTDNRAIPGLGLAKHASRRVRCIKASLYGYVWCDSRCVGLETG